MAIEENPDFTSYAHIDPDNPSHWASYALYMENVGPSNTPFRSPPNRALEVFMTAEGSPSSSSSPFSQFTGPFRFLDLPSELRVAVYTYLLPYDRRIWFDFTSLRNSQPAWKTRCVPKPTGRFSGWADRDLLIHTLPVGRRSQNAYYEEFPPLWSLFLVNKHISSEARAVLYGSNTFKLKVNGSPHKPISLQSSLIFGPLGLPHRLHLLRDLRHIELEVMIDETNHWVAKRHRGRLEHFVNIIKQHADDKDQQSLLKYLKVRVTRDMNSLPILGYGRIPPWQNISGDPQYTESFMFALESLAALHGIKEVEITGVMPWFAQCLELCIRGKGGEVLETDWPLVEVKRKRTPSSKKTATWISTRKWHQPMLNWKEFAERNEIAVPEDIEKYWASA